MGARHVPHASVQRDMVPVDGLAGRAAQGVPQQDAPNDSAVRAQHGAVVRRRGCRRAGLRKVEAPFRHQLARCCLHRNDDLLLARMLSYLKF